MAAAGRRGIRVLLNFPGKGAVGAACVLEDVCGWVSAAYAWVREQV